MMWDGPLNPRPADVPYVNAENVAMSAVKIEHRPATKYSVVGEGRAVAHRPVMAAHVADIAEPFAGKIAIQRARDRATRTFNALAKVTSARISDEELGDAMERLVALAAARQGTWRIYWLVLTTAFWVLVHTAHAMVRGLNKRSDEQKRSIDEVQF